MWSAWAKMTYDQKLKWVMILYAICVVLLIIGIILLSISKGDKKYVISGVVLIVAGLGGMVVTGMSYMREKRNLQQIDEKLNEARDRARSRQQMQGTELPSYPLLTYNPPGMPPRYGPGISSF